jgi:hypothetical protein
LLRILSVQAVSLALAARPKLALLLSFVANKPAGVCACLVLGAAVPRHLYRLKRDKRKPGLANHSESQCFFFEIVLHFLVIRC